MSAIAPLLATADLLAFSTVNSATRLLVLTPALWRQQLFTFLPTSACAAPSPLSLGGVVQVADIRLPLPTTADRQSCLSSLHAFPSLRHLRTDHYHEPRAALRRAAPTLSLSSLARFLDPRRWLAALLPASSHADTAPVVCVQPHPAPPVTSLASLRHLTRITLQHGGELEAWELQLLCTLPVLASFAARFISFAAGSEETLAEWQAVTGQKKQGRKRKARDGDEAEEADSQADEDEQAQHENEQRAGRDAPQHDPAEPSPPQRHSPLLLFLHALAAKPSFVHLRLELCYLTPYVMEHMPVWPHLLCLAVEHNDSLEDYSFVGAAARFPSLTSLTSPSCHDAAIEQLVRLPRLEELRFPEYSVTTPTGTREVCGQRGTASVPSAKLRHCARCSTCLTKAAIWIRLAWPRSPLSSLSHTSRASQSAHTGCQRRPAHSCSLGTASSTCAVSS